MAPDQKLSSESPPAHASETTEEEDSSIEDGNAGDETDDSAASNHSSAEEQMAASKGRDPDRPKRKKARRACSPCQRAHLTCSTPKVLARASLPMFADAW